MITTLVLAGRYLERRAKDATLRDTEALAERTQPALVLRERADGAVESVWMDTLVVGDTVVVRAAEKCPVDGELLGTAHSTAGAW